MMDEKRRLFDNSWSKDVIYSQRRKRERSLAGFIFPLKKLLTSKILIGFGITRSVSAIP
jgi:hypothetical protein